MRMGAIAGVLTLLTACGGFVPVRTFEPIGEFETTQPKGLVEGGRGKRVSLPNGVRCVVDLAAFRAGPTELPEHRFEMSVTVIDAMSRTTPRTAPVFDHAELVDDAGQRFPCRSALVPAEPRPPDDDEPATAQYTLVFDVPVSYRFRAISGVTVHWHLRGPGDTTTAISSRFGG